MAEAPDYVVSVGPNHYANGVAKTKVELKGNPKQKNGRREAAMVTLHRFILAATAALALITPAYADNEEDARNHGYQTAALEVARPGLIVTDKKLRAKRDRMFRYSSRWKEYFTQGYDFVVRSYSRLTTSACTRTST
jgi:hypothetical protein